MLTCLIFSCGTDDQRFQPPLSLRLKNASDHTYLDSDWADIPNISGTLGPCHGWIQVHMPLSLSVTHILYCRPMNYNWEGAIHISTLNNDIK